ncbi:MAG: glutamate synthase subunit alpha, partial [Armatimonadetes bacterium]|nr:glutamate synthase subunit alpha [Armatimonadota bacterium]
MTLSGLPPKQGLYDPQFEHDSCGVGFVVHMKGKPSHEIVEQGLTILKNLEHRGAVGAEVNTGDGAGVLMQVPDAFLRRVCREQGISLPAPHSYGVGMVFLPADDGERAQCEKLIEGIVAEEGQTLLGWRAVPTDDRTLGETAKDVEPVVRQVFIGRGAGLADDQAFERKLYVIRQRAAHAVTGMNLTQGDRFYVLSL